MKYIRTLLSTLLVLQLQLQYHNINCQLPTLPITISTTNPLLEIIGLLANASSGGNGQGNFVPTEGPSGVGYIYE